MRNRFVILNNERDSKNSFNRQRNVSSNSGTQVDEEKDVELKSIKEFQKNKLRNDYVSLNNKRFLRTENRTIIFLKNLDLIKISFFKTFNIGLQKQFLIKYGLSPIEYLDFNKTVMFQIESDELFQIFQSHVDTVINSPENTTYQNQEFNLIALIFEFSFLDSDSRIQSLNAGGILLNLITTHINEVYTPQKNYLLKYLGESNINFTYKNESPDIIEIKEISQDQINVLADNFDIVKVITSSRTERIKPGILGPIRDYGFDVLVPENLPIVGVIDTGINKILPLENVLIDDNYNHTIFPPNWDEVGHGTMVAGLIVLGDEFYTQTNSTYDAKARILNIKALHFDNDDLNIPQLLEDLKDAKNRLGVRIFNMSLVIPNAKKYNSSYSQFAYELDKLAFEEDLLVFLSVGNFNAENLNDLKNVYAHESHNYPAFFYNLESTSDSHACEDTNICEPSESLNNISVGALAGNFDILDNSDITPLNFYPAHYTRKFHLDYKQLINSTKISQKNKHLNKPDFVFEGGDLFNPNAGLEILRSPLTDANKYFSRTSGTSLATPLLTSYAAEILYNYPTIKTQTIKAILINSATYHSYDKLDHFKNHPESLLKSLVGFGKPNKTENLLFTNNNSIQYLIEDKIKVNQIIKIPIILPDYLVSNGNKLQFDISLSYSFAPIKDNHLNYLPLHISFNIVKNLNIDVISDKQEDYGIKSQFSWSEDHFGIDNRLFSNAQKKMYRLQPNDLTQCNGSIGIAVRCLAKNNFPSLLEPDHYFSIAIKITEIATNKNTPIADLYNEMIKINNFVALPATVSLDNSQDIDLEN